MSVKYFKHVRKSLQLCHAERKPLLLVRNAEKLHRTPSSFSLHPHWRLQKHQELKFRTCGQIMLAWLWRQNNNLHLSFLFLCLVRFGIWAMMRASEWVDAKTLSRRRSGRSNPHCPWMDSHFHTEEGNEWLREGFVYHTGHFHRIDIIKTKKKSKIK